MMYHLNIKWEEVLENLELDSKEQNLIIVILNY